MIYPEKRVLSKKGSSEGSKNHTCTKRYKKMPMLMQYRPPTSAMKLTACHRNKIESDYWKRI
jgi:hypothetical protein